MSESSIVLNLNPQSNILCVTIKAVVNTTLQDLPLSASNSFVVLMEFLQDLKKPTILKTMVIME